jgi:hypothetical protein
MTTHTLVTAIISILSLSSIGLAYYHAQDLRKFACLFGLAAQPFWIAHVIMTEAWGILPLTPAYTILYLLAIKQHWLAKDAEQG